MRYVRGLTRRFFRRMSKLEHASQELIAHSIAA